MKAPWEKVYSNCFVWWSAASPFHIDGRRQLPTQKVLQEKSSSPKEAVSDPTGNVTLLACLSLFYQQYTAASYKPSLLHYPPCSTSSSLLGTKAWQILWEIKNPPLCSWFLVWFGFCCRCCKSVGAALTTSISLLINVFTIRSAATISSSRPFSVSASLLQAYSLASLALRYWPRPPVLPVTGKERIFGCHLSLSVKSLSHANMHTICMGN